MKELHDEENTIELIESSEEHLKPSCSNDSPVGCSFLDLTPLSEDTLIALEELGEVLKQIHRRMKSEGYEIVDGVIRKV
jgi:hypothetical protein